MRSGGELGLPSNLLAHHLKLLEQADLIERSRSEGDYRRTYLRFRPSALDGPVPTGLRLAPRVVFVCTHNSARSQLAAACAGNQPARRVHPLATAAARQHGLSLGRARTWHVDEVLRPDDLVVAVCDNAHEYLGTRAADRLHWSVPDPARVGTVTAFEATVRDLTDRDDRLAPAIHHPERA